MNEQDKKALIDKMKKERDDLLTEGSVILLLTDLVSKKAREVRDRYKGREIKGKYLMMISVLEGGRPDVYRAIVNDKEDTLSEKGLKEMREAVDIIDKGGYGVRKLEKKELEHYRVMPIEAYEITM